MAGVWVEVEGRRLKVELSADGTAQVDGVALAVDLQELEAEVLSLLCTGTDGRTRSYRCTAVEGAILVDGQRVDYAIHDPRSLRAGAVGAVASGPKPLKAPMPGRVVRVLVADGEAVEAGQGCVVIEAMKMQNELKAPRAGIVRKLAAVAGETVISGAVLLVVE